MEKKRVGEGNVLMLNGIEKRVLKCLIKMYSGK